MKGNLSMLLSVMYLSVIVGHQNCISMSYVVDACYRVSNFLYYPLFISCIKVVTDLLQQMSVAGCCYFSYRC